MTLPTPETFYTQAELALINRPELMATICAHVAAGGTVQGLCDTWNRKSEAGAPGLVRFGAIWQWIVTDDERRKAWQQTQLMLAQADEARLKEFARGIAFTDVRALLTDDGRVRPVSEWPAEAAMLIAGLDVAEMFEKGEANAQELVGVLKKVKLADRIKGAQFLAQLSGLLVERKEVSGKVTMEQLVAGEPKP